MAAWLDSHLPDTCRVLVSPADRAQQTALALKRKFKTVPELAPGARCPRVLAAANWPDSREPVLDRRPPAYAWRRRFVPAVRRGGVLVGAQGRGVVAVQPRTGRRRGGRA